MDNRSAELQQLFSEGSELLHGGNAARALDCFRRILAVDPLNPLLNLYAGTALHDLGRYEEAVVCYETALQGKPQMGEIHNNLGNSLMALGRFGDAADSFSRAVSLLTSSPVPLAARATALQALGKVAEAEADCRKAIIIAPDFAAAHWNLSLSLLLQGRYEEGWREYEWRWRKPDFTSPLRHADVPLWDGSPLHGQNILLHAEQGFGDAIQFVRYAPLVAKLGGNVIVECHPQLASLFMGIEGDVTVIPFGSPMPDINFQIPLLSLPKIFGTTLQNIPSRGPYLAINPEQRQKWSSMMSPCQNRLKTGLVWAGKSYPDPLRSCLLSDFASLASDDVAFYSLQLGNGSEETKSPPSRMQLSDLTGNIRDFADTAALIEQMDLVISIDTAVAHLSGALGKPTWLLLPYAPDWRWLLERGDSPWYPAMRIYRQKRPGAWGEVIERVRADLEGVILSGNKKSLESFPKD